MSLSIKAKEEINNLIDEVVKKYIGKATDKPKANSGNPFVLALLKDFDPLIHSIHGLKTSLGVQLEKIAEIIAIDAWGSSNVQRNLNVKVVLPKNVFQAIDTIINDLTAVKTFSDYEREKRKVIEACKYASKDTEQHTYEYDLIITDPKSKHTYILEMKTPDPNTTEVKGAKQRLLAAFAWAYLDKSSENIDSQLAIYYNNKHPNVYKNGKVHNFFNPDGGTIVQESFWNFIGKNPETYYSLTKLFESYGETNKKEIWSGFSKLINIK